VSNPYDGESADINVPGVLGVNTALGNGVGVDGRSNTGLGVIGRSISGTGLYGTSTSGPGAFAQSNTDNGMRALSHGTDAVAGISDAPGGHSGVYGRNDIQDGNGVTGTSVNGRGLMGLSDNNIGIFAKGGQFAGVFEGNVFVSGNITTKGDVFLTNADCAEEFDIIEAAQVEPGTVMVLDQEGALRQSEQAYDKRVAGVISGAGDYKPGIILDKQQARHDRMPVALVGKVYCKVDAQFASIEVGDLLTTSPTPGHAMRTDDPFKAFGAVIGKALRPFREGQGLIPILIALQ
jgi:hypothetical protein